MIADEAETIAAVATAPGRGGVGIVRISGPASSQIAQRVLQTSSISPRQAHYKAFYNDQNQMIDKGLALYFPGPNSFTGEDVVELQGHGGPVVMEMLLEAIVKQGARVAQPGEFSQRAFLNGKIDLAQAEAVADLIDASTRAAAMSANRSLQGVFSQHINALAQQILQLRIYVEAAIDFPDEEIDFLAQGQVKEKIEALLEQLHKLAAQAKQGQLLKEGMIVVIVGQPNAGKSSLLNALTQQESAIVTPIAGTTRDLIKETIQIDGLPVHIIDTAGIRDDADLVEQEGIRRAKRQLDLADQILLVKDCTQTQISNIEQEIVTAYPNKITWIMNKVDLKNTQPHVVGQQIFLSAKENKGLELLQNHLKQTMNYQAEDGLFMARRRHLTAIEKTHQCCQAALVQLVDYQAGELVAEELKQAHTSLGEIVGQLSSDELLGNIFSSFCIGK